MYGRILVVDDDDDDRYLCRLALEKLVPFDQVVYVSDPAQAVQYLTTCWRLPDLLITDLNMPGMNGDELVRQVRQTDYGRHLPMIVWSTSAASTDRLRCYQTGANAYLVKPTSPDRIAGLLKACINIWLTGEYLANCPE